MIIRTAVLALALSAAIFAAPSSAAAPSAALPSAALPSPASQDLPGFTVTAPDGAAAPSAVLDLPGQWLLVYLAPGSAPSDRLLQSLGESWSDARAGRVIFIVSGTIDAAKAHLAAKGGDALAANARWYADQDRSAWKALGFTGTLAVSGMIGTRADWKIDGVIADPSVLEPAVQVSIQ